MNDFLNTSIIVKQKRANTACTRLVGVCAFSGTLRGLELVPAKWRYLVPPQAGNASRWADNTIDYNIHTLMFKTWLNPKVEDICPNCGSACATTDVLCPKCGKNLDELFEQLPDSEISSLQQTFRFSIWWKILIALNIVVDVPFLPYAFTGYQWNCKYNGLPDIAFTGLAALFTLILVWAIIRSTIYNRKFLDGVITALFVILFGIVACFSSFSFVLSQSSGQNLQASIPSPNAQRIAELCVLNGGPGGPVWHTLRVGHHLLPYVDLYITDLKYEYPTYFVPQIEWIDDSTIRVREAGNTTRTFQVEFIQFEWQSVISLLIYTGIKYGLVLLRLRSKS